MTKILGISGKKQSGKDTAANYILGHIMKKEGLTSGFKITPSGKLFVNDLLENNDYAGIFDYDSVSSHMTRFKKQYLDNHIKLYSFADCLKKEICIKMLGLTYEQCYGTDEQKNSLTHLKWEDMPGVITEWWSAAEHRDLKEVVGRLGEYYKIYDGWIYHAPGFMSARETLQFIGTELMRRIYNNCHVNATMNQIKQDAPEYAIIRDTRFVNEVEGVQENGMVVRLLRDVFAGKDQHESETALDNYPHYKFNFVVDNTDMAIIDQNQKVYEFLKNQGWNI